jgi:hypothetical protein
MKTSTAISAPITICSLLLITLSFSVFAAAPQQLKHVGQGTMSWLFMDIYQAALFSADGSYQPGQYPQALSIRYQRDISKQALLKATRQEWQKLSVDERLYRDWLHKLSQLWPEIKDGDNLTFLVANNGHGDFYHNGTWLGRIDSPAFSEAFLSIWLSPRTSEPGLRRQLLGERR